MRHVWSILLAVVLAPTVWLLCGANEATGVIDRSAGADGLHSLTGLALLLSAGSAYATLVLLPISPAGPTLAGLGYLGLGLWALVNPGAYAGLWPSADAARPGYGLALLLAVPLIATALLTRRWEPSPEVTVGAKPAGPDRLVPIRVPEADGPARRPAREPLPENNDEATTTFATTPAEVTTALVMPRDEEATTVLPTPPREASPEPAAQEATAEAEAEADQDEGAETSAQAETETTIDAAPETGAETEPTGGELGSEPGDSVTAHLTGEKTQVIARDSGETTRIIRPADGVYPTPGETTRTVKTAEPAGERTQAIKLPAVGLDPEPAPSVAEAERPDPGADPTTRIVPAAEAAAEPDVDADAREVATDRPATVLSMERPPDEVETEARTLPRPRKPQKD